MANYLERVASSAGRRATIARPPNSGPPVLPPGRDVSVAAEDPFASDQDQFLESFEAPAPARSAEIASTPKLEVTEESRITPTQDPKSVASAVPKTRPPHERLSSESPFTVHLPRTLRPISTTSVPPTASNESRPTAVEPEKSKSEAPIIRSTASDLTEIMQSVVTEADAPALPPRPRPPVTELTEEHQLPRPIEVTFSDPTPIPRVDRVDGPNRLTVAEPSPPAALPVQVPPVAGSATRQEQSRITIGSLEVLVNNHPKVTPSRSAPTPSRTERLNLEKRYLDRFRLRH